VKRTAKFTKFPDAWEYQLARIKADGCTYRLALYLLRETWRTDNNRVRVANGVLEAKGVSRWAKQRDLKQLERTGLIAVRQQPRKSPVVTVRFTD